MSLKDFYNMSKQELDNIVLVVNQNGRVNNLESMSHQEVQDSRFYTIKINRFKVN